MKYKINLFSIGLLLTFDKILKCWFKKFGENKMYLNEDLIVKKVKIKENDVIDFKNTGEPIQFDSSSNYYFFEIFIYKLEKKPPILVFKLNKNEDLSQRFVKINEPCSIGSSTINKIPKEDNMIFEFRFHEISKNHAEIYFDENENEVKYFIFI